MASTEPLPLFNLPYINSTDIPKPGKYNPLWDLMIRPTSLRRYPPIQFHIGMWNEWTGKLCTDHPHPCYYGFGIEED